MTHETKGDHEVTRGLYLGRMTTAQRTAFTPASDGAVVYDTDIRHSYRWDATDTQWNLIQELYLVDDQIELFNAKNEFSQALVNTLAQSTYQYMTGMVIGGANEQRWLPALVPIMVWDIPKEMVAPNQAVMARKAPFRAQAQTFRIAVNTAAGATAQFTDVSVLYGAGAVVLANELTLGIASGSNEVSGIANFTSGFAGIPGLIRENDVMTVQFGANVDNSLDFRITLYGYDLTPAIARP